MSDWKSKLPDLKEVVSMTTKLATDIKNSVCEIIEDYKKKHPETVSEEKPKAKSKAAEDKAEKKEDKTE